jgi:methyl-accepting chemotaxis protein
MIEIADQYELTLDPEIETYYLMEAAVMRQPVVLERLGRLRALGTGVLAGKSIDEQRKIAISIQVAELLTAQRAFAADLDKVAKYQPTLAAKLKEHSQAFQTQGNQLLKVVNEEILSGTAGTAPTAYFDLATQTIDTGYTMFYEDLIPTLRTAVEQRVAEQQREIWLTVAAALLVLAVCVYFLIGTAVAIVTTVAGLKAGSEQLAGGDLTTRVEVESRDELGEITESFNTMAGSIRQLIQRVQQDAQAVAAAARQLADSSRQIRDSTAEQSDAAAAMAAAVEQLTVGVDHISQNSQEANRRSAESGELSAHGGTLVGNVIGEIERIAGAVHAAAQTIEELGRQSDRISTVVNVIKDIADQTNLLALNAAIEAARAGESGRGFAVVADEVRKLAERTAKSTSEITEMISAIQGGAREAVVSMEDGVERVNEGVRHTREAGTAMQSIENGARDVVAMVSEISDALREQSAAATEIAKNVERIAQMAEQNSVSVDSNAATVEELDGLAEALRSEVSRFKV